ncbi:hypothetical protein AMATHDRAFT_48133 [Amanita thiersii Skay4041]|uniref:Uncharacterized protein n=1 Tax=Amanita thiersii Skay4041 TaxID=703135 RepID=A0A2A9NHR9_9AGAR|nr:hypothetical protein AMATHDRAFT_48133 [Amanita thiersii Skay4041]
MSINEPFVIATYNHPLFASTNTDYVSVAVQSDGAHVIQLSTLRPVISHTLGPSTTFASPPLTVSDNKTHTHTTYAVIQSSSDLREGQLPGKTIWIWTENLSSSIADRAEAHKKKAAVTVPHTIAGLYHLPELPRRVIVVSHTGEVSLLDADSMRVQTMLDRSSNGTGSLVKTFVYPRVDCTFLSPNTTRQDGAVVVLALVDSKTNNVVLEAICITSEPKDNPFIFIGSCKTEFSISQITDFSCSTSGYVSILTNDGHWHSHTLDPSDRESFTLSPTSEPFKLKHLRFSKDSTTKSVALLPLTSSHVLLAGISSSKDIVLHIWDLQYSVLITTHVLPLPSVFASSPAPYTLTLVPSFPTSSSSATAQKPPLVDSQALLVLAPPSQTNPSGKAMNGSSKSKSKSKPAQAAPVPSTIFVIPYVVARQSTIANAMGRASASAQWIAPSEDDEGGDEDERDGLDEGRRKVLKAMQEAMVGNRPQAANEGFLKWEKASQQGVDGDQDQSSKVTYGYGFVKRVLEVVLQPEKNPASVIYSSEIVRHLMQRRVVSAGMVEGGLVKVLKAKNDWVCCFRGFSITTKADINGQKSIELALENVIDLRETEIAEALWDVIISSNPLAITTTTATTDPDAMQVDSNPVTNQDTSSLTDFLALCVEYKTTPAHLRVAVRQQLLRAVPTSAHAWSAAECALAVLHVLVGWIRAWTVREVKLMPEVRKREDGVWVVDSNKGDDGRKSREKEGRRSMPELSKILAFTETFLDATFLTLVQHSPAQEVLKELETLFESEIAFTLDVQPLFGALDQFARAHERVLREAEERASTGGVDVVGKKGYQEDWRQRKKRQHEQAGMGIGLYQVEELVL